MLIMTKLCNVLTSPSPLFQGLCRQLRMATLKEKAEWMQKLRERAAGSLTNRRRTAEKVI